MACMEDCLRTQHQISPSKGSPIRTNERRESALPLRGSCTIQCEGSHICDVPELHLRAVPKKDQAKWVPHNYRALFKREPFWRHRAQFGSKSGQDPSLSPQETTGTPFLPQTSAHLHLEWRSKMMLLSFKPKRTIQLNQAKARDQSINQSMPSLLIVDLTTTLCVHT